jgi:hypothetical protein
MPPKAGLSDDAVPVGPFRGRPGNEGGRGRYRFENGMKTMRIEPESETYEKKRIDLVIADPDLDFIHAKQRAKAKALELSKDAMLLSWNDRKRGMFYPQTECGRDDRPAWILYAESRGANLTVSINDGEYTFMFILL